MVLDHPGLHALAGASPPETAADALGSGARLDLTPARPGEMGAPAFGLDRSFAGVLSRRPVFFASRLAPGREVARAHEPDHQEGSDERDRRARQQRVVEADHERFGPGAVAKGAPDALQVADRWHLLHGLTLALEEFLLRKHPALRDAASQAEAATAEGDGGVPDPPAGRPGSWRARKEEAAAKRHERLVQQWQDIRRLHLAGADARFIAKKLRVGARTVYRYRDLEEPPPRQTHTTRASVLDPYVPYLF